MERNILKGEPRGDLGSRQARRMRDEGWVPANLYGHAQPNLNFRVRKDEVSKLIHEGHHIMSLEISGKAEDGLLKEIQFDTYGDHIVHVDFARISLDEVVEMNVPVVVQGVPKGLSSGGVLDVPYHDVVLRGKARSIPEQVPVEIGELMMGDAIRAGDLTLPDGVEVLLEAEEVIVIVHAPKAEVADEESPSEPEVIGEKKPDGE